MENNNIDNLINAIMSTSKPKAKNNYDYREQLINDCISELKKKNEAYCFKKSQVEAIQAIISCDVSYDGIYTLTPVA